MTSRMPSGCLGAALLLLLMIAGSLDSASVPSNVREVLSLVTEMEDKRMECEAKLTAKDQEISELKARSVSGSWGAWSPWSDCSRECRGTERRQRDCDSPVPAYGGSSCPGDHSQERSCNTENCLPGINLCQSTNKIS